MALTIAWHLTLQERLICLIGPPVAFIVVVTIATAVVGHESIVFYQTTITGTVTVALLGTVLGGNVWRLLDVALLGIGVVLVFGRIGCFAVACCHGRPARHGVTYGPAHVAVGFWPRWSGRTLFPIQLVESACSLGLVVAGLVLSDVPGRAALVYAEGYAVLRFALEHLRGDPIRPFARGLSEAQWSSIAVTITLTLVWPSWWTIAPAVTLAIAGALLVRRRRKRELFLPPHLREIDQACAAVISDPSHAVQTTQLGVGISCRRLDDGRLDWVMSSTHPMWSPAAARRIAASLWVDPELVDGRVPGIAHVIAEN